MKSFKRIALLSGLIIGLAANIGSARSAVVYDWSGTCTITCTGTATAVLTLTDAYVPGTAVDLAHLVSFSFSSSAQSYTVPGDTTFEFIGGTLPSGSSSSVSFFLDFPGLNTLFITSIGWNSQMTTGPLVQGTAYEWSLRASVSPVPLPASAWMFISSLLAFGAFGWWRRRRMAATV